MTRFWRLPSVFFLFIAIGIAQVLHAQSASSSERYKIEVLIKYVSEMNGAKFVRNGSTYDAKAAATFLRLKKDNEDLVTTCAEKSSLPRL
jgi:hypothetical protein